MAITNTGEKSIEIEKPQPSKDDIVVAPTPDKQEKFQCPELVKKSGIWSERMNELCLKENESLSHTSGSMEEGALELFLAEMDKNVFVKSTNSVTGKVEELTPSIKDMEAIIAISGEWDREDLKGILNKIQALSRAEGIEGMKMFLIGALGVTNKSDDYVQALKDVLASLTPKEDKI